MTWLAAIRPDDWNYVLLLHVGGAMILVGGTLTGASSLAFARGNERLLRLGYWSLLSVGLPGYVLMRIGAEWMASREGYNNEGVPQPSWLGIGYLAADAGFLVLLVALIVGGIGVWRLRGARGSRLLQTTMALTIVLLAGYVVAIWAMAGKPA